MWKVILKKKIINMFLSKLGASDIKSDVRFMVGKLEDDWYKKKGKGFAFIRCWQNEDMS